MAAIEFSEEQTMLGQSAADFCARESSINNVRALLDSDAGIAEPTWRQIGELGWLAITVPEAFGGLGLGLGSVAPIAESMGRHLMGGPFFATTVATQALVANASDDQKERWLPAVAAGQAASFATTELDGDWDLARIGASAERVGETLQLQGEKRFVLDLPWAHWVVATVCVDGEPRLLVIEQSQLAAKSSRREVVVDETRRSFALRLDGLRIPADQLLPKADLQAIERTALLLLAAEISGGLTGVLQVIVDYLNTRKQFDRLIGSYQSLKHPTVQILLSGEAAKSHLYHAATLLDRGEDEAADTALRIAKAHGSDAFAHAGDRAVQFHGGFGFTYECDAQLFLRRALWCQYQFGDERHHRQLLAPTLLDEGAG